MLPLNQIVETPCYIIDEVTFKDNYKYIYQSFENYLYGGKLTVGYSVKTNHNTEMIKYAHNMGMLAEVVSDDEYDLTLLCGYASNEIIFNGPQKSEKKLIQALKDGSIVNIDNLHEIDMIQRNISDLCVKNVKIGLRVNFDLEGVCPSETTAGKDVSRFGLCFENGDLLVAIQRLNSMGIAVSGLHMHYSSRTRSVKIFEELSKCAGQIINEYGLTESIRYIDIGGGFFMGENRSLEGKPTMEQYAATICKTLSRVINLNMIELIIEPGASLIASSIQYICSVINKRDIRGTSVLTCDGSTLHINPFIAKRTPIYEVIRVHESNSKRAHQIICGATCMEADRICELTDEAEVDIGDYIVCRCVGAYTMAFNNTFINLPPYIYWYDGTNYEPVRKKTLETMQMI